MPDELSLEVERAFSSGLKALSRKSRTRHEMADVLARKGFSRNAILKSLAKMEDLGYINDRDFAFQYAVLRATERFWGRRRIRAELGKKGVPEELIASALEKMGEEVDEDELLEKAIRKKMSFLTGSGGEKDRARLYRYLLRRGFPGRAVLEKMKKCKRRNDDEIG